MSDSGLSGNQTTFGGEHPITRLGLIDIGSTLNTPVDHRHFSGLWRDLVTDLLDFNTLGIGVLFGWFA